MQQNNQQQLTIEEKLTLLLEKQALIRERIQQNTNNNLTLTTAVYNKLTHAVDSYQKLAAQQEKLNKGVTHAVAFTEEWAENVKEIVAEMPLIGKFAEKLIPVEAIAHKAQHSLEGLVNKAMDIQAEMIDTGKVGTKSLLQIAKSAGILRTALIATGVGALVVALGLVVAGFAKAVEYAFHMNKEVVDMSKHLGVGYEAARNTYLSVKAMHKETKGMNYTFAEMLESAMSLNEALGMRVAFDKDTLLNNVVLTENMGLQQESASKLLKYGAAIGVSALKYYNTLKLQTEQALKQNKSLFSSKEILEDILKTSAHIRFTYGKNTDKIAESVVLAKQLGMEMGDVLSLMDRQVDLQEGIASQMQATVLLGNEIPIQWDKINKAAVTGDYNAVLKEMHTTLFQSLDYMEKLPGIQKQLKLEGLAQAFGRSKDEISQSLELIKEQRHFYEKFGKSVKELNEEELKRAAALGLINDEEARQMIQKQHAVSLTDKLGKMWENVQTIIVSKIGPTIENILAKFTEWLGKAENVDMLVTALKNFASVLGSIASAIGWIAENKAILYAVLGAAGGFMVGGGVGAVAGAIAGYTGGVLEDYGDKVNAPTTTVPQKVGDAIITKTGEVIHTSPEDHIIATKNAPATVSPTALNIQPLQNAIEQQTIILKQIADILQNNRQHIVINGKVIDALNTELNALKNIKRPLSK